MLLHNYISLCFLRYRQYYLFESNNGFTFQDWLILILKVNWEITDSGLRYKGKLWLQNGKRNLRSQLLHGSRLMCLFLKFVTRTVLSMTPSGMLLNFCDVYERNVWGSFLIFANTQWMSFMFSFSFYR